MVPYPQSIKIGEHKYTVQLVDQIPRCCGSINYTYKVIKLALNSSRDGRSYKREDMDDTFWHEVTHGILYEMGNPLWRNEAFVTQFANLLTKAIHSAKF